MSPGGHPIASHPALQGHVVQRREQLDCDDVHLPGAAKSGMVWDGGPTLGGPPVYDS